MDVKGTDMRYMIWIAKYRHRILTGRIGRRTRELICQGCQARNITILQDEVGKDYMRVLVFMPNKPGTEQNRAVSESFLYILK